MRDLLSIADRIEDISREMPVSSYAGFIEETNRRIRKIASKNAFYIDVFRSVNASSEVRKTIKAIESGEQHPDFVLLTKDENNYNVRVFEDIFPSIALIFVDEELVSSDALKHYFRKSDEQYKVIFLVSLVDETTLKNFSRLFGFRSKIVMLSPADFGSKSLSDILSENIERASMDKLKKFSYLNSVKPIFSFLSEILSSENRAANTRKLLLTQNTNISRKEEQAMNVSDLNSNIRNIISKAVQDFEKSYRAKYEELNKPNIGKFSVNLKEKTEQLEEFEQQTLAEKNEKVDISIKPEFQEKFIAGIRKDLSTEFSKDDAFVRSSFDDLIKKINIQLKSKGIAPVQASDVYIPFPTVNRVLDSYCYLGREFKGELMKKGATEYFVALRDYTGIIMVAVGLLGPLNGITMLQDFFSDAEKNGGSESAALSIVTFFKGFNATIKILTAVITIGMITYGIIDLKKRIPRRRVEEYDREMGKARELLAQEGKKMYGDSSKDWLSSISSWIKDVSQNLSFQIEKNMKDHQLQKMSSMNQDKLQIQKQQQSIELLLKGIQSAERVKDQITTRYRDLITETEKDLKL